jgi:hypothetical protein
MREFPVEDRKDAQQGQDPLVAEALSAGVAYGSILRSPTFGGFAYGASGEPC